MKLGKTVTFIASLLLLTSCKTDNSGSSYRNGPIIIEGSTSYNNSAYKPISTETSFFYQASDGSFELSTDIGYQLERDVVIKLTEENLSAIEYYKRMNKKIVITFLIGHCGKKTLLFSNWAKCNASAKSKNGEVLASSTLHFEEDSYTPYDEIFTMEVSSSKMASLNYVLMHFYRPGENYSTNNYVFSYIRMNITIS